MFRVDLMGYQLENFKRQKKFTLNSQRSPCLGLVAENLNFYRNFPKIPNFRAHVSTAQNSVQMFDVLFGQAQGPDPGDVVGDPGH